MTKSKSNNASVDTELEDGSALTSLLSGSAAASVLKIEQTWPGRNLHQSKENIELSCFGRKLKEFSCFND